jgi:hypothetical protein
VVLNANLKPPTLSLDSSEAASTFIATTANTAGKED